MTGWDTMHIQKSFQPSSRTGTLYLVGTPIGNLEDMTYRAVRILQEVDWIAAEDTRQTRKLLNHFGIRGNLVSYHEHNVQESGERLIRYLNEGRSVALVSDAGLPAISDPGHDLVVRAAKEGIPVVPIPGANAALSALIVSGLPTERFLFVGFLPRERKKQREALVELKDIRATLLVYEAPHRLAKTLLAMLEVLGNREIAMVRELTKLHEEVVRGTIEECVRLLEETPALGEYCLVVSGEGAESATDRAPWWAPLELEDHVRHYEESGLARKEAMRRAAADRGLSRRDVYNQLVRPDPS